jgi:tetrahydromethanopterin:alpha-L-glutamate ligase
MPIRLGIVGSATGPYVRELVRAAGEIGAYVHQLAFPELSASIGLVDNGQLNNAQVLNAQPDGIQRATAQSAFLQTESERIEGLDAVIVRTMPLGSLEQVIFRMDCLQVLQSQGTAVVNSPKCLETSIDKWLTLHRLAECGLPVPPTIACQTRDAALEAFEVLGRDVLVKPLFGGEGRGIIRLSDPDLAWRTLSTLSQLGHVLYLQQYIANFGYDIRVLVIGDQLLSIRREAQPGSYRSNISMGGIATPHELSHFERDLAIRAASAVGGDVVGVDLMPARDGQTFILEVNAVPGWRGVASSLSVDVAKQIVRYVASKSR